MHSNSSVIQLLRYDVITLLANFETSYFGCDFLLFLISNISSLTLHPTFHYVLISLVEST